MKSVKLLATGLEFQVEDTFHYHDDGLVPNIVEHIKRLERKYGGILLTEYCDIKCKGITYISYNAPYRSLEEVLRNKGEVDVHIFVLQGMEELPTVFCKGHEETHILLSLNRLEILKSKLSANGIASDGIEAEHKEVICDIGGFLAVMTLRPGWKELAFDYTRQGYNYNTIKKRLELFLN